MTRHGDLLASLSGLPDALRTARFGRPLHVLPSVASTNDTARQLAEEGAGEGAAVLALRQTGGRGRRGRSWASPPGGLYLSVVLRPSLPAAQWPVLSLAVAVGAAEGAEGAGGPSVSLKWPNDLLAEGGKIGGILLESAPGFAIAGIGINVRAAEHDSPPSPRDVTGGPAASRRDAGLMLLPEGAGSIDVDLVRLARAVLEGLEGAVGTAYGDPAEALRRWKARSVTLGHPVHVVGAETFDGVAEDVAGDGALLVRTAAGVRRVVAGEVSLR